MIPGTIHLLVRNRKKIFFDNDIKALTSLNDKGTFDILPEHAHFISLIQKYILVHTLDGKEQKIDIGNGVLKVSDNQVQCYIDLITPNTSATPSVSIASSAAAAEQGSTVSTPKTNTIDKQNPNTSTLPTSSSPSAPPTPISPKSP